MQQLRVNKNPLPIDKNINRGDRLFVQPVINLFNQKHWSYLERRYHMSSRELQVATLVCRGFNNDEIAKALEIRCGTVKTHLRNIYRRVRVKSKIVLLLRFIEDTNRFCFPTKPTSSLE